MSLYFDRAGTIITYPEDYTGEPYESMPELEPQNFLGYDPNEHKKKKEEQRSPKLTEWTSSKKRKPPLIKAKAQFDFKGLHNKFVVTFIVICVIEL